MASEPSGSRRRRDQSRADETRRCLCWRSARVVNIERPPRTPSRSAPASPSSTAVDEGRGLRSIPLPIGRPMKTIIFYTAKRARTPKMQGLATAAGSASVIRELCRLARCGTGRVYLVDAPTAEHGRRRPTKSAPRELCSPPFPPSSFVPIALRGRIPFWRCQKRRPQPA